VHLRTQNKLKIKYIGELETRNQDIVWRNQEPKWFYLAKTSLNQKISCKRTFGFAICTDKKTKSGVEFFCQTDQ
jgi:hypothetical protein